LVSPDEFDSWKETLAIRENRDLIREIKSGLASMKSKKTALYNLDELFES
jgi:PHD/YefM family antitoxin component YafN of YafNO toxin-antitoxin module